MHNRNNLLNTLQHSSQYFNSKIVVSNWCSHIWERYLFAIYMSRMHIIQLTMGAQPFYSNPGTWLDYIQHFCGLSLRLSFEPNAICWGLYSGRRHWHIDQPCTKEGLSYDQTNRIYFELSFDNWLTIVDRLYLFWAMSIKKKKDHVICNGPSFDN